VSQQQALNVLATLTSNGGALGQLVRNLWNIDTWFDAIRIYEYTTKQDAMDLKKYYRDLLSACPKVQVVDLSFSSTNEGFALLRALRLYSSPILDHQDPLQSNLRLSTLRRISFSSIYCDSGIDLTSILEALQLSSLPTLSSIEFTCVHWRLPSNFPPTRPSFPLPISSLNLYEAIASEGSIFPFFPRQTSVLQYLRIEGREGVMDLDFTALQETAGGNLQKLEITVWAHLDRSTGMALSIYSTTFEPPRLPPNACQAYPSLTSLELTNTHGPSLALLETLVKSSPLLFYLSFFYSRWICHHNPRSTSPNEIFPEDDIVALLKKFLHLKHIRFGYLPTVEPLKYEGMKGELEAWGIKVEYQICTRV